MRHAVTSIALALIAAMVLLAEVAPAAPPASASVPPSASVAPSGSTARDVIVELFLIDAGDPAHEWDIKVTGGSPSVDHLMLEDIGELGFYGAFTVDVVGQSATVEVAATLPPGWELVRVSCRDNLDPPTQIKAVFDQRSFAFQVVPGRRYGCFPTSDLSRCEVSADVCVEFFVNVLSDPTIEWDIAVTGGVPSVDHLTLQDPIQGEFGAAFTIDLMGESASLKMTTALPAGRALTLAECFDDLDPPTMIHPKIEQGSVVFEVVNGRRYSCIVQQLAVSGIPGATDRPAATVPSTDTLAEPQPGASSGWLVALVVLAGVIAAGLLIAVRIRRHTTSDRS